VISTFASGGFMNMFKQSLKAILLFAAVSLVAVESADARVVGFEVTSNMFYGTFRPGDYVRLDGKILGELSPSERIPDLDKAPRNSRGMVEYVTPFVVIMPKEAIRGNGALLIDVPNRGRPISLSLYNSPRDVPMPLGSLEAGTGFLQDRGFSVAMVRWEHGQGITLPIFIDADGKTRYIEGVGFAAVRDLADFLRYAPADSTGRANPMAGAINRSIAFGYSQTARFLKSMLLNGFNMTEGRRVFDGMHLQGAHAGLLPIMQSVAGPDSSAGPIPTFKDPNLRGVHESPMTYAAILHAVKARGEIPPRLLVTNMTTDYLTLRASLARTGDRGTTEAEIPANVRLYDVAGASHVISRSPGCMLPKGQLDWSPIMRATLIHLDEWVSHNVVPPPTRLMPLEPNPGEQKLLQAPPHLQAAVVQMPKRDADGNFVGGVRLPDVEAPLGVHGGQNEPLTDFVCSLSASFVAFAKTKAEREAANEKRLSLEERYAGRGDYLNRVRTAAAKLMNEGFLLEGDVAVIVQSAAQNTSFKSP
jgi:alpha/beta hydrolase family protein